MRNFFTKEFLMAAKEREFVSQRITKRAQAFVAKFFARNLQLTYIRNRYNKLFQFDDFSVKVYLVRSIN
ncbi:MAG: hypothetical protein ICV68_08845 [Pyrinomonadaceae bacterium]|nr:hypothetical protein [Pyrinomonadaceae bacterium]